jgi:multiple sugar transport system permease protein
MRRQRSNPLVVAAFLLPSFVGFFLFILLPAISTVGYSFTNYSGGKTISFIGLENYVTAFRSSAFWNALWVTAKFVVVTVTLQIVLGFGFAVVLDRPMRGRDFFRGLFFMPTVLSAIAVSLAFMLLFNPSKGPVNMFLESIGLQAQPWLASEDSALGTIIFVILWQSFGYYMVLYLSGLQSINRSLYESADIDGASPAQQLVRITIPMLSPTTFFCVTIAIIRGFQVFDQVFVMTGGQAGGGPAGATTVLVFDIYRNAFVYYKLGYASAEATILLLIVLVVTVLQYRGQTRWVNYDL